MNVFGSRLRNLREQHGLLLRQVAALLEIDTALISKIERGERRISRKQVVKLSNFFNVNEKELLTLWLSDKVLNSLEGEPHALDGLKQAVKTLTK